LGWRAGVSEADFGTHQNAVLACKAALSRSFDLFEEVRLNSSQLTEKSLKVDLLAVPKAGGWVIGLEVKRGFYRMSEYAAAIKQAADYRLGTIDDSRLPLLKDRRISAGFVFPRWHGGHDEQHQYRAEAYGMERLSHHFRVGFADYDGGGVTMVMDDKRLWTPDGWSGNAPGVLGGKERIGSLRLIDPARLRSDG
jgi:hypothetical protein